MGLGEAGLPPPSVRRRLSGHLCRNARPVASIPATQRQGTRWPRACRSPFPSPASPSHGEGAVGPKARPLRDPRPPNVPPSPAGGRIPCPLPMGQGCWQLPSSKKHIPVTRQPVVEKPNLADRWTKPRGRRGTPLWVSKRGRWPRWDSGRAASEDQARTSPTGEEMQREGSEAGGTAPSGSRSRRKKALVPSAMALAGRQLIQKGGRRGEPCPAANHGCGPGQAVPMGSSCPRLLFYSTGRRNAIWRPEGNSRLKRSLLPDPGDLHNMNHRVPAQRCLAGKSGLASLIIVRALALPVPRVSPAPASRGVFFATV